MDSVGLGQSFKEECENCKRLELEVARFLSDLCKAGEEISALESRVDELEDEKQDIMDNPEQHFDWGDLD